MAAAGGLESLTAAATDLEALVEIRLEAMRESLDQIGRFDPRRARQRLTDDFDPQQTTKLLLNGALVGFYVLRHGPDHLSLDHLYLRPAYQARGLGAQVLAQIKRASGAVGLPVRLAALKGSPANGFYRKHGFVRSGAAEWDIFYTYTPPPGAAALVGTARLELRPVVPRDRDRFTGFYGDAAVMAIRKYGVMDAERAAQQLASMCGHWLRHGFGMWSVWVRSCTGTHDTPAAAFAGECGLRWVEDGSDVELSYGLAPAYRGRGLATEAARAALEHGFNTLQLERIVALSRGDNRISHRVLEKLGMRLVWRRAVGEYGLVRYELAAPRA